MYIVKSACLHYHVHVYIHVPLLHLQAIERFAHPGSDHIYTVVNKSSQGVRKLFHTPSSSAVLQGREGKVDPPYVNQSSIPTTPAAADRPLLYRKSPSQVCDDGQAQYTYMYM